MAQWIIDTEIDLAKGRSAGARQQSIQPLAYPGNAAAHGWRVTVMENGYPYIMSGHTITAYLQRADGNTVLVQGSVSGNVAQVVFPAEVYAVPGVVHGIINATVSGQSTTALDAVSFTVRPNLTGNIIDPGSVIPASIDEMLAIIGDAQEAATNAANATKYIADTYDATKFYVVDDHVIYNGKLYRFNTNHAAGAWNANEVTESKLGKEVSDLKSAIDEIRDGYGKNLFDSEKLYGVTGVSHANGIFSAKASDLAHFVLLDGGFDANAAYTVSFYGRNTGANVSGNGLGVKITFTNETNNTTYLPNSTSTFTQYKLTSDASKTIQCIEFLYNSGAANVWDVKEIQIEKGSSASAFVPFFTAYDRTARDGVEELNTELDDVSGLALSSGEISISSLTHYPDFNDFPLNRIVHVVGNILPENAPPGYVAVGHNNADSGKYSALVMTFSAMTNLSTVVQKCIYYNDNYPYDKLPRTATRYARIVNGERVWTDWSVMSENTVLHASDKVVDVNSYQTVTFSDFNDAPVNAIYQVDLNVGDTILNNPSPGHSGLFMTFSFSPVSHHALVQHFYALESATEFVLYFRYGYKQSSADLTWTEWKRVATDIDGKFPENKGRIASWTDLNTLTDNAVYLMGYNYTYINRPWESLAGFITTKTVGLITLQIAEGLDGTVKRRSTADGGATWTAWG